MAGRRNVRLNVNINLSAARTIRALMKRESITATEAVRRLIKAGGRTLDQARDANTNVLVHHNGAYTELIFIN